MATPPPPRQRDGPASASLGCTRNTRRSNVFFSTRRVRQRFAPRTIWTQRARFFPSAHPRPFRNRDRARRTAGARTQCAGSRASAPPPHGTCRASRSRRAQACRPVAVSHTMGRADALPLRHRPAAAIADQLVIARAHSNLGLARPDTRSLPRHGVATRKTQDCGMVRAHPSSLPNLAVAIRETRRGRARPRRLGPRGLLERNYCRKKWLGQTRRDACGAAALSAPIPEGN